jgi:hypothetical protein
MPFRGCNINAFFGKERPFKLGLGLLQAASHPLLIRQNAGKLRRIASTWVLICRCAS